MLLVGQSVASGAKTSAVAAAAKRLKRNGDEPTYSAVVAACPRAVTNPTTGEPVDKKLVYAVFQECCYDTDPADTWGHYSRLARSALDDATKQRRWEYAKYMIGLGHSGQWFFKKSCVV